MALFQRSALHTAQDMIPPRPNARRGSVVVTKETSMRHSAVWACVRLRSDLVSTMPIDCYRRVLGRKVEVPKPRVLVNPSGDRIDITEWMYNTQSDLDRSGNTFGIITELNGFGLPARIDLVPTEEVSLVIRAGELKQYRIGGTLYDPEQVWHEKAYTMSGLHVGLSPVAAAAWAIGEYLSAQEFVLDWFGNGTIPSALLRNKEKIVDPTDAAAIKTRYRETVATGDVFVTGSDWEHTMIQAKASEVQFLETKEASIGDIARFFGCPSDLIDAAVRGQAVTYANITQRNLQFLIMHLGPALYRRERALSRLLQRPRFVKLNSDALLRMDAKSRAEQFKLQIDSRTRAPSEVREIDDLPPFTEAQLAEFDRLFGPPRQGRDREPEAA